MKDRRLYGLVAVVIRVSGDFTAMAFFEGYDITKNLISDLGTGAGNIFFNMGVFIAGLFLIPFFIVLGHKFKDEGENEYLRIVMLILSLISAITFSLLGVTLGLYLLFPQITLFLTLHFFFATACYIFGALSLTLLGIMMIKSSKFSKILPFICFMAAGTGILFLLMWTPLIEWISTYFILFTIAIISCYLTFFTKIKLLPVAIEHAIYWGHFSEIAERIKQKNPNQNIIN